MHVHIELDQCEAHGRCALTDPDLFQLDDDGYAARADVDVPPGNEQAATAGAASCPMSAIRVTEA
ncbi:ferredoxin [Nocardioides sp. BP30]|uniref:ferredoxin n=1 Tax=Nocardioides sp. BP30 TaxID=3036374 RepID=UPI0024690D63|nr:ferredoxin [Nocardioides sp. BP30]WGL54197.1 ferredoxin [Nocardioides sp. BP30]